jgi:2-polyprenyl-6-methoxyphenol hydroxylase-like FAD-dependent oxidoreductase
MDHAHSREHAVVLGAGIAGLLTTRVLSETYHTVTVIERDQLPAVGQHRKGVPHGRHLHGLHPRGREILEELFPGLTAELMACGAAVGDVLGNARLQLSGHTLAQADIGLPGVVCSRPFLEGMVRARLAKMQSVRLLDGCAVAGLTTTRDAARVTGVRVAGPPAGTAPLAADLVVDTTGRGSRTPKWLAEWGYPTPSAERVDIGLSYSTAVFRLRPGALGSDVLVMTAPTPRNLHAGWLAAVEGGRHIVTLSGLCGERPPTDPSGFRAFAQTLVTPDISAAVEDAVLLESPVPFHFPASVRHRYERLRRFPGGLLVLGDAVCSFNPIYGQGMTVAATQAIVLRRLLAAGAPGPREYFRQIAPAIEAPWQIAVGGDLAFPQVPGHRSPRVRLLNAYLPRLHAAATHDPTLGEAFVRVLGLVDPPQSLLRPAVVRRVLQRQRPTAPLARPAHASADH